MLDSKTMRAARSDSGEASRRDTSFGAALLSGTAVSPTTFLGQRTDEILKRYRDLVGHDYGTTERKTR